MSKLPIEAIKDKRYQPIEVKIMDRGNSCSKCSIEEGGELCATAKCVPEERSDGYDVYFELVVDIVTPRSILHDMQANRIENERLLDLAHKAGIYAAANNLGGGFISLDRALQLAARSGIDLDEGV